LFLQAAHLGLFPLIGTTASIRLKLLAAVLLAVRLSIAEILAVVAAALMLKFLI
jgi:hypothetical protein